MAEPQTLSYDTGKCSLHVEREADRVAVTISNVSRHLSLLIGLLASVVMGTMMLAFGLVGVSSSVGISLLGVSHLAGGLIFLGMGVASLATVARGRLLVLTVDAAADEFVFHLGTTTKRKALKDVAGLYGDDDFFIRRSGEAQLVVRLMTKDKRSMEVSKYDDYRPQHVWQLSAMMPKDIATRAAEVLNEAIESAAVFHESRRHD